MNRPNMDKLDLHTITDAVSSTSVDMVLCKSGVNNFQRLDKQPISIVKSDPTG
jgi:hypothetical protein